MVREFNIKKNIAAFPPSEADYLAWREPNNVFEKMATFMPGSKTLTGRGEPEEFHVEYCSVDMLPLLGVQPLLGRNFTAEEDKPGGPLVVILSNALWRNRFNASKDVIGQSLDLDNQRFTVIGVMSAEFHNLGLASNDISVAQARFLPIQVTQDKKNMFRFMSAPESE